MRERDIEAYLRERVVAKGGLALKFTSPGRTGVPDRIILLPYGRIYFVEVKAPGGKLSDQQARMHIELRSRGFVVRVVDSHKAVDAFIAEFAA